MQKGKEKPKGGKGDDEEEEKKKTVDEIIKIDKETSGQEITELRAKVHWQESRIKEIHENMRVVGNNLKDEKDYAVSE